jgi:hypothetical protein
MIAYSVENGILTSEQAAENFSLSNYILQSIIGSLLMGILTSAMVSIFTRQRTVNQ